MTESCTNLKTKLVLNSGTIRTCFCTTDDSESEGKIPLISSPPPLFTNGSIELKAADLITSERNISGERFACVAENVLELFKTLIGFKSGGVSYLAGIERRLFRGE